MKTKEELNELKLKLDALNKEIQELTDEELDTITGGQTYVVARPGANILNARADELKSSPHVRATGLGHFSGGQRQRLAATEAMTLGARIVIMKDGVVQQIDTPQNLYLAQEEID